MLIEEDQEKKQQMAPKAFTGAAGQHHRESRMTRDVDIVRYQVQGSPST